MPAPGNAAFDVDAVSTSIDDANERLSAADAPFGSLPNFTSSTGKRINFLFGPFVSVCLSLCMRS